MGDPLSSSGEQSGTQEEEVACIPAHPRCRPDGEPLLVNACWLCRAHTTSASTVMLSRGGQVHQVEGLRLELFASASTT